MEKKTQSKQISKQEEVIANLIPEYLFILEAISAPPSVPGLCKRWQLLKSICRHNELVGQGLLNTWTGMTAEQRKNLFLELSNGTINEPGVALRSI